MVNADLSNLPSDKKKPITSYISLYCKLNECKSVIGLYCTTNGTPFINSLIQITIIILPMWTSKHLDLTWSLLQKLICTYLTGLILQTMNVQLNMGPTKPNTLKREWDSGLTLAQTDSEFALLNFSLLPLVLLSQKHIQIITKDK